MSWKILAASCVSGSALTFAACKVAGLFDVLDDDCSTTKRQPKFATFDDKFTHYATVVRSSERLMSVNDVIASLSPLHPKGEDHIAAASSESANGRKSKKGQSASSVPLQNLMSTFDLSGDGFVSYEEYCALMTLLSVPSKTLRRAFDLRSDPKSGTVGAKQLRKLVLSLVADPTVAINDDATLALVTRILSNKNHSHHSLSVQHNGVTFSQLQDFIQSVEKDIIATVFQKADCTGAGRLPLRAFRRLVLQQVDRTLDVSEGASASDAARAARFYGASSSEPSREAGIVPSTDEPPVSDSKDQLERGSWFTGSSKRSTDTSRKAAASARTPGFSEVDLYNVLRVLKDADAWLEPLRLFTQGPEEVVEGNVIDKKALYRAFIAAKMLDVTPRTSNAVFDVFDVDGSGTLTMDEMEEVALSHASWFATQRAQFDQPERNWVQRVAKCLQQRQ